MNGNKFFTTSDGARLYFEDRGKGLPLILLPGLACTTKFFSRSVPALSERYRVITLDPRGHGRSSKTLSGNNMKRMALDVQELIDKLELTNVVLAGWSMGGQIAATYAHIFAEYRLLATVFIDAPLYAFSDDDWNEHRARWHNIDAFLAGAKMWMNDPERYYEVFAGLITDKPMSPEDKKWFKEEISHLPPLIGVEQHLDFYHTDNVAPLASYKRPVLIMGAESEAYGGIAAAREYDRRVQSYHELHEFHEGGHMFFYFYPERFNLVLIGFIEKVKEM